MDSNFNPQSLWNFDDDAMKTLKYYSDLCLDAFSRWDLAKINDHLRSMRRIASWGISKDKWDRVEKLFSKLEAIKREIDSPKKNTKPGQKEIEFYNQADEIFIEIGRAMQEEGWVFRKGHDPKFAALRR